MCCLRGAAVGDERAAVIHVVRHAAPSPPMASSVPAVPSRGVRALACAAFLVAVAAWAQPTVTISPSRPKSEDASTTVPSAATDQAAARRLEEERRFRINRVIVEGFRDPDYRVSQPQILEQRFGESLNRSSPELIAGRVYDGCHFDGSFFSCADPLSSALRNLRHALR
jgi:hypothetical protein